MINQITAAIYTRLTSTPEIVAMLAEADGVFEDQADDDSPCPFIIISSPADNPEYGLGDAIQYEEFIYRVHAVTDGGDAQPAGALRDMIDAALTESPISISGQTEMSLERMGGITYSENHNGTRYNHRGATYRYWIT